MRPARKKYPITAAASGPLLEPLETRLLLAGEGFTAYNDLVAGPTTHVNATRYDDNTGDNSGQLKNITTGADTSVLMSVINVGGIFGTAGTNPAAGTQAATVFANRVHFGSGSDSIELDGSDTYTYIFSDLSVGNTYDFTGTAVRGEATYTNRWTLVTLVGAESFTIAHSSGLGIVTAGLPANQVAIWTGANHTASQGFVVRFSNINPGADGEFEVVSQQYRGPTPGVGTGDSSGGGKGYGLAGIRLIENAPTTAPTVVNTAATSIGAFAAQVGGQITSTGGQTPTVTLYYGDNDGGTIAANWDHAIVLGPQTGSFSTFLDSLPQNTNHFFRAFASNSVGGSWASSTATFKTLQATLPAVTTAAATAVGAFSATLNGSVTSTGNDPPIVRIYYGNNDGGADQGLWDDFIEIGVQSGTFSATVNDLDPLTAYHFRAFAQNSIGGAWAGASMSFATTAIPPLRISEFMADNANTISTRIRQSPTGSFEAPFFPDWIEIYNPSTTPVSLAGMHLTDDSGDPDRWTFPAGTTIGPQSYLLVFASSEDITNPALDERGILHTNFGLSKGGEYLALTGADNTVIHSYPAQTQNTDISYGIGLDGVAHFYSVPTPGGPNTADADLAPLPATFSAPSATFTAGFQLVLSTASPGAVIRYTTNGTVPTTSSPIYTGPISITTTTQVRAIVIGTNSKISPIASRTYVKIEADAQAFTSDLPIVVIDTFAGTISENTPRSNFMAIIEPDAVSGRSAITGALDFGTRSGIQIRGSSSAGFAKKSYSVEFWNEADADNNLSPLGMPAESDWVLYAPGTFDRALINNPFVYEMSNDLGRYAVRTRWVEVYLNTGGGGVANADYVGLYVLMERITRDDDRVPVEPLTTGAGGTPVTGGFMLKIDRADPGDTPFTVQGITLNYVEPKQAETTAAQRTYITNYMNAFMTALNGANFADPVLGYAAYIDVDSFIDHNLINMLTKNVDALRLSTYMFKTQNGKLEMGPVWDFDRALDSTDSRDNAVNTWSGSGDATQYFSYGWWARLFADPNFMQRYIDRWQELRKTTFSIASINAMIDGHAAQINEAQARDYARWSAPRFGGFAGEIAHVKDWLAQRIAWIDTQWLAAPVATLTPGQVTPGTAVPLTATTGSSIYYTLNGTDPRAPGGGIAPGAILYTGPITITQRTTITARAKNGTNWSGFAKPEYFVNPLAAASSLRITEIHYNPAAPSAAELAVNPAFTDDDFEFVELMNVSAGPIDLPDANFSLGIDFNFRAGSIATLQPGERVVIASNLAAFQARYGAAAMSRVAGAFDANLANGGEQITLLTAAGLPIADFFYGDSGDWPGRADGKGSSLELINPAVTTAAQLADPLMWRSSSEFHGSPGVAGLGPDNRVLINEILTHTDPPLSDSIELHNTTFNAINVGGWYLSDSDTDYRKFRIPDGTIIPAGGYLVFDESDFNPSGGISLTDFAFDAAHGDDLYLVQADAAGNLQRFVDHVDFGAGRNGESFGRWPDGEGPLYPMISRSFGGANPGPRVGPVVITEVMYNPPDPGNLPVGMTAADLAFIELFNPTASAINLAGFRFGAGVDFTFAAGTSIAAGARLLVLRFDPASAASASKLTAFNSYYGLAPGSIAMRGGFTGQLSVDGETLRLERPDEPPAEEPTFVPYLIEDEVKYDDVGPWPTGPDGGGTSLQRRAASLFGSDAASWRSAAPSPGSFTPVDAAGPRVVAVGLVSTTWSTPFLQHLAAEGAGGGRYVMPTGQQQLAVISWQQVNQVSITFSEDVAVLSSHLTIRGVTTPSHAIAGFSYDAGTFTARWTLAAPVAADKLVMDLADAVRDVAGNALDGEWSNGASSQSGNGSPGGAMHYRINSLPGDANRSGQVLADDAVVARNAQFLGAGGSGYSKWLDFDGSGAISTSDVNFARSGQFTALPATEPATGEAAIRIESSPPSLLPATVDTSSTSSPDFSLVLAWLTRLTEARQPARALKSWRSIALASPVLTMERERVV